MPTKLNLRLTLLAFVLASPLAAGTVTLDFEDGALPSATGWQPALNESGTATHIIVPGNVPGKAGSKVLRSSATNTFGWYLDLNGQIDVNADWTFSLDFRRVSSINLGGGGINDIGITKYGSQPLQMNIGSIVDTDWHTFLMSYDAAAGLHAASIDGNAVASVTPSVSSTAVPDAAQEYILFAFGNINVVKVAEFDNLSFSFENPAEVPLPSSILLGLSGVAFLGGMSRRKYKQTGGAKR